MLNIQRGYKFRLYPNKVQVEFLNKTLGSTRAIYNILLYRTKQAYEQYKLNPQLEKPRINPHEFINQVSGLRSEYPFLKDVSSNALLI